MKGRKPTLTHNRDPLTKAPSAPAWLSPAAKAEWRRIMPRLIADRIVTKADLGSVESYCVATGRVKELEALLSSGFDASLWRAQNQAMQTAKQLAGELGLTPVSRRKIEAGAPDDDGFLE